VLTDFQNFLPCIEKYVFKLLLNFRVFKLNIKVFFKINTAEKINKIENFKIDWNWNDNCI